MKDLLKKPLTFDKIEFWAVTAIYVLSVFVLLGNFVNHEGFVFYTPYTQTFQYYHVPYSYTRYWFLPQLSRYTIFYVCYVLLSQYIISSFIKGEKIALNVIVLCCLLATGAILLCATQTWIRAYLLTLHSEKYVYTLLFKTEFLHAVYIMLIFGFYNLAKYGFSSVLVNFEDIFISYPQPIKDLIIGMTGWGFSVFFLIITRSAWEVTFIWSEIVLFSLYIYWYSSTIVIPKIVVESGDLRAFISRLFVTLIVSILPVGLLAGAILEHAQAAIFINLINIGVNLFLTAPISWYLYQRRLGRAMELTGLKTALGRSSANLDFLRSQINPHFLFNALNTLYGTALQENADRTGEGIQKLGDMMRFMLQENVQEKIALSREIDYLNNYIDLQKLRTQTSPDILIVVEIDEQPNALQIAPMLLIPFVENAFKHGISLRETSHIKISLQTRGNQLLFDVYNSIHHQTGTDPEKDKSGIGLENVKQRLQLLYAKQHDLTVRESANEFFIHLTVNL